MYKIEVDIPFRMLKLTLEGFWTVEVAHRFATEQELAVARLGPPYGTHLTLADVRNFEVQRREVVDVIRNLVVNARSTYRRIALVGQSALSKLQFARIIERDNARIFNNLNEAHAWLLLL